MTFVNMERIENALTTEAAHEKRRESWFVPCHGMANRQTPNLN